MDNRNIITSYYTRHRDELLAFVSARLGDSVAAEDIVQDVFVRLLTTDKLMSETTLPSLVYTMARHRIVDHFRRHTVADAYEHYLRHAQPQADSAESVLSIREFCERLECGLARLPERCSEVYRLHIYGGMKVSEISRQLGESYKSVEHRLGQARSQIRLFLADMVQSGNRRRA